MTHILRKLRDDVAGMRRTNIDQGCGCSVCSENEAVNDALDDTLTKIDAAIDAQPEPDELVAKLRARQDDGPDVLETEAADLITSQQAEIRALTAERDAARLRGMIDCETICDDEARQFSEGDMTESKAFAGSAVRVVRRRIREAAAALTRKDTA